MKRWVMHGLTMDNGKAWSRFIVVSLTERPKLCFVYVLVTRLTFC